MSMNREDLLFHIWPGWPYIYAYMATGALGGVAQAPIEYFWSQQTHTQPQLRPDRLGLQPSLPPSSSTSSSTSTSSPTSSSSSPSNLASASVSPKPFHPPPPSLTTFLTRGAPALVIRASLRFAAFGQFKRIRDVKRAMGTNKWPRWLDIAASGGAAGLVEIVTVTRFLRPMDKLPHWTVLARHPVTLFCGFGTYGFLSTSLQNPPEDQPPRPFWRCWLMGVAAGGIGCGVSAAAMDGVRGRMLWGHVVPRGALSVGTLIAVQVTTCPEVMRRFQI